MSDQVYRAYFGELGEKRENYTKTRIDWIIDNVVGNNILDIGCSQGICSIILGVQGKKVFGLDIDEESIQFAKEKLQQVELDLQKNIHLEQNDFLKKDFCDMKFDTIIMTQVLEHLENPIPFIEKATSLFHAESRLIVTVPFGINEAPDHKRTYYMAELYKQLEPFCSIMDIEISDHWIGMICAPSTEKALLHIDDLQIILKDEKGFYKIERELRDLVKSRKERNLHLETQRDQLKKKNAELETQLISLQKDIAQVQKLEEEVESLNQLLSKKTTQINKYSVKLNSVERAYNLSKNAYLELSESKLGKLQLAYWHSPALPARIARFIYRGIKSIILGRREGEKRLERNLVKESGSTIVRGDKSEEVPKKQSVVYNRFTRIRGSNNAVLFMATNGAGLGHLTRSMAIAKRIRTINPDQEIVFLTTSVAVNILHKEGFMAYHIPPKTELPVEMTSAQWGDMLRANLEMLFSLYDIKIVVFDGAYPYAPFVQYIGARGELKKIWVKRGSEKPETIATRKEQEKYFDHIIIPSEAGQTSVQNDERHTIVNPIIFINRDELLSRGQVRRLFKVPEDKLFVYVQLGAGANYNLQDRLDIIFSALRKKGNIVIALGESIIGDTLQIYEEDVVVIKDYPNSKYFNGFDFVVSACGYNTFHELMYFGVPTLFMPTAETGVDDQLSRAMLGVKAGIAIALEDYDQKQIEQAIDKLSNPVENQIMRENAKAFQFTNGAAEAAKYILS